MKLCGRVITFIISKLQTGQKRNRQPPHENTHFCRRRYSVWNGSKIVTLTICRKDSIHIEGFALHRLRDLSIRDEGWKESISHWRMLARNRQDSGRPFLKTNWWMPKAKKCLWSAVEHRFRTVSDQCATGNNNQRPLVIMPKPPSAWSFPTPTAQWPVVSNDLPGQ